MNRIIHELCKTLEKQCTILDHHLDESGFYIDFIPTGAQISSYALEEIQKELKDNLPNEFILLTCVSGIASVNGGQRISGKCFSSKITMDNYIDQIEAAKQSDHKKLGEDLGIFIQNPLTQGSATWLKNGTTLIKLIYAKINNLMEEYDRVMTPLYAKSELWKRSGHYDMYKENMFIFNIGDEEYALKPMNCPLHAEIFKKRRIHKHQLPIKIAEFGCCHRNEASGALNGLLRARCLTIDDGHVFCAEEHIEKIAKEFCLMLFEVYRSFDFKEVKIYLSTRPEKYIGDIDTWNKAEQILGDVMRNIGHEFVVQHGDGAFYGPKLEFHILDNLNRSWQCGTIQLDFMLAERLEATYEDNGEKKYPVMMHHAILGSTERFIGILLEHCKGWLPMWCAPVQVLLLPIKQDVNISPLTNVLKANNIRFEVQYSKDSLTDRIKKSFAMKMPAVIAVGDRDLQAEIFPVRLYGAKEIMITANELVKKIGETL